MGCGSEGDDWAEMVKMTCLLERIDERTSKFVNNLYFCFMLTCGFIQVACNGRSFRSDGPLSFKLNAFGKSLGELRFEHDI